MVGCSTTGIGSANEKTQRPHKLNENLKPDRPDKNVRASEHSENTKRDAAYHCQTAVGYHMYWEEMVCPVGREKFKALRLGTHSTIGTYLDLSSVSYLRLPAPKPVCPSNGFVIDKKEYTDQELAERKRIIETDDYTAYLFDGNTTYYIYAKFAERLNDFDGDLWWLYLTATHEAGMCDLDKYEAYVLETLPKAKEALAALNITVNPKDERLYWAMNLLIPNLYRRIGDFDAAETWMNDLTGKMPEYHEKRAAILKKAIAEKSTLKITDRERG